MGSDGDWADANWTPIVTVKNEAKRAILEQVVDTADSLVLEGRRLDTMRVILAVRDVARYNRLPRLFDARVGRNESGQHRRASGWVC